MHAVCRRRCRVRHASAGVPKSAQHRERISQGLYRYHAERRLKVKPCPHCAGTGKVIDKQRSAAQVKHGSLPESEN
jgi:hypothetical protein